jgi:hypothetical protein
VFMGLRARLEALLSRGEAPELDPDELVVLETVQAPNGPMMVEALRDAGIEAVAVEAFDAVTARHAVQMKVPRRQVQEATEVLDNLR